MFRLFFTNKMLQMTSMLFLKGLATILSISFASSAYSEPEGDRDSQLIEELHKVGTCKLLLQKPKFISVMLPPPPAPVAFI